MANERGFGGDRSPMLLVLFVGEVFGLGFERCCCVRIERESFLFELFFYRKCEKVGKKIFLNLRMKLEN